MTVIASAFTRDGFVIAADGNRRNQSTGKTALISVQKIYLRTHPQFQFAYAWAGATVFETSLCGQFDFASETALILHHMEERRFNTADEFIRTFSDLIREKLVLCIGGVRLFPTDTVGGLLARILFIGYFDSKPVEAHVFFDHANGELQTPSMNYLAHKPYDFGLFSGSESVFKEMVPTEPLTLADASSLVESYARRCISGCGIIADCVGFGGHVHVALVTPNNQTWIIPPLE